MQQQYTELCARYEKEVGDVEELLGRREEAYLELLGVASDGVEVGAAPPPVHASRVNSGSQQQPQQQQVWQNGGTAADNDGQGGEGSRRILGLGRLFSAKKG